MNMNTSYTSVRAKKSGRFTPFFRQLGICFTAWLSYFMFGLSLGTPTVTVPQLRREANSTSAVTDDMASWLTSICGYSGTVWVIVTTIIAHYIGRKKSLTILSINTFAASAILYFSTNAVHVLISQFLHGMTTAAQLTTLMMIITEYSSAEYRGIFLTLKSATFSWGLWCANAIGIFTHFKYIGILGIVCSIYSFVASLFIPESPFWLASRGRYDECAKAHRWLKGSSKSTMKELEDLIHSQRAENEYPEAKMSLRNYFNKYKIIIQQPEIYKPITLSVLVFIFYHLSGKLIIAVYAVEMMKKITSDVSTAHIGVLIMDGFSVLGMYVGAGLSKILKRRTLFMATLAVGAFFLLVASLYLYLIKMNMVPENSYLNIFFVVGYSLAASCGPMIMSTSIASELMPVNNRTFSICVFGSLAKLFTGISLKTSPYIFKLCGFHGTFLVFGISSVAAIVLIYKFIPETKDKTLYEISMLFQKKKHEETMDATPLHKIKE